MAKLMIEVDTETKDAKVTVNGTVVDNVSYVSLSNYNCYYDSNDPSWHFSVETSEVVGDVNKRTSLCASQMDSAKASEKYPGLYEKTQAGDVLSPAGFNIAKAFTEGRKVKSK